MGRDPQPHHADDPVGERALAAGIAAFVASFIPGVGDFVAVPAAIIAIVLGLVGIQRFETGRAARVAAAACGTILGAAASLMFVVVLVATELRP
ncbi:MAG: hypothetical protein ACOH2F_04705 [Cellulomonas sp.]